MIAAGCVVALREGCAGCAGCVNAVLADSVDDWRDYQTLRLDYLVVLRAGCVSRITLLL